MNRMEDMEKYVEEVGGVFIRGNLEAIPYNHWKKDNEWLVLIVESPEGGAFVPVQALTPMEAATSAFYQYILWGGT